MVVCHCIVMYGVRCVHGEYGTECVGRLRGADGAEIGKDMCSVQSLSLLRQRTTHSLSPGSKPTARFLTQYPPPSPDSLRRGPSHTSMQVPAVPAGDTSSLSHFSLQVASLHRRGCDAHASASRHAMTAARSGLSRRAPTGPGAPVAHSRDETRGNATHPPCTPTRTARRDLDLP